MLRSLLPILSSLVLSASASSIPGAVEMRPGIYILKGGATPALYSALKQQHITHVVDLRKDSEITPQAAFEVTTLQEMKVHYMRYATSRVPPAVDLDFIRALLRGFPKDARIVITCNNGNRAAAAVCPWLILDQHLPVEEVLVASRRAGLAVSETEEAIRGYLKERL